MNSVAQNKGTPHYVQIDEKLCNGCVLCTKACPTKSIRVKEGRVARIEGFCIDCGNCIRVCPKGAIKAITTGSDALKMNRYTIVNVSPVLYAQFGEDVMPNDVLLALRKVFNYVYDQSYTQELFNVATELYISESRKKGGVPWPVCPVVNHLIAYRFPSLLKHILPITTPREIAARELRKRMYEKMGYKIEDIGVYHVTPCSAKMISIKQVELKKYLLLESDIATKMKRLSRLRESITTALKDGSPVEDGDHFAYIKKVPGRRSVSWKKVVIRLAGEAYANRVMAATKPGSDREELAVE